jgi:serine/threonine protein kinase
MDNTLLDDHDPPRIKLCDFGFAKWWTQEPHMTTITGEGVMLQSISGSNAYYTSQNVSNVKRLVPVMLNRIWHVDHVVLAVPSGGRRSTT